MTVLAGVLALAVFVGIVSRPSFGAYLYLFLNPLIVGVARGDMIPVLRPNEMLLLLVVAALGVRTVLLMLSGRRLRMTVSRVDVAIVLLAVTSSVLPLLHRYARGLPITNDDILYSLVLWKYYLLYRVFVWAVSTEVQVARCLWVSMASGAVVAIVAMLQVGHLLGAAEFLHAHYDQPFEGHSGILTERASSTIGSAFGVADVMIMNGLIANALAWGGHERRWLLIAAAGLFLIGCFVAGEFSGYIGLMVAMLVFGYRSGRLSRILAVAVPSVLVASVVFWPVLEKRLEGFESPTSLPHSWVGRLNNLQDFFFPQLFSNFNWLWGVRPAPRLPATETWREWIYIESGYVWLLWIGGIPLFAAFVFFVWVALKRLARTNREQSGAVGAAAGTSFAYLIVIVILMLLDPHLTVRGSADLFFPILALSFVRSRNPGRVKVGGLIRREGEWLPSHAVATRVPPGFGPAAGAPGRRAPKPGQVAHAGRGAAILS
ncbi:MAG TPA: hypothetical protein VD978_08515 [Azospirillum sp.]|nr:hypothetical protein [Azospirillum sp.]